MNSKENTMNNKECTICYNLRTSHRSRTIPNPSNKKDRNNNMERNCVRNYGNKMSIRNIRHRHNSLRSNNRNNFV